MDRLRVLLADDYRPILDFVRHLLDRRFDIVGLVADGESLVDAAKRLHPDIIILDITMPLLSGLQAAGEISKQAKPPKLIFLTLLDEPGVVEKALSLGASGYVLKSALVTDLEKAIQSAINGQVFVSPLVKVAITEHHWSGPRCSRRYETANSREAPTHPHLRGRRTGRRTSRAFPDGH